MRCGKVLCGYKKFSARLRPGGAGPLSPNVNLGPPDISEITRARQLNLNIQLDIVKYPFWYKNYYITRYNMRAAAILTFDKCLDTSGQTTANNCKTAFSLHVKNFHGSLTTVVRAQNDTSKTANITFSILHVERYTRPYQRRHAKMKSKILKPC